MKTKLLWLLCALFTCYAHANELKNFDELKSAIQTGHSIRFVIFLNECQSDSDDHGKILTALSSPTSFMIVNNQISTSVLRFTRNEPSYKERSIFEFFTYKFNDDNSMLLHVQTLDAPSYSPLGTARERNCVIGSSVKLFSEAPGAVSESAAM
jgi:hypothetical protein